MEETKGVYVEDQVLFLPQLKHGVKGIGDLWNCQTSKPAGRNLFGESLGVEELRAVPTMGGDGGDFRLLHVKETRDALKTIKLNGEMSVEFLAGLIEPTDG